MKSTPSLAPAATDDEVESAYNFLGLMQLGRRTASPVAVTIGANLATIPKLVLDSQEIKKSERPFVDLRSINNYASNGTPVINTSYDRPVYQRDEVAISVTFLEPNAEIKDPIPINLYTFKPPPKEDDFLPLPLLLLKRDQVKQDQLLA